MNQPIILAQATQSATPVRVVKIEKPADGQAITIQLSYDQSIKVDFSAIANERIIIVRVGERAVILFDNGATVTLDPFWDSLHRPLANLEIEFVPGQILPPGEFLARVPITIDQSILPAAGEGTDPQDAGASFSDPVVDPIFTGPPLDLLPPTELGTWEIIRDTAPLIEDEEAGTPPLTIIGAIEGMVEEEELSGEEQQSEAGDGNEDPNDQIAFGDPVPDPDGNDTDTDTTDNIFLSIGGSLSGVIGGGVAPYTFSIFDVTADLDLANDLVRDVNGNVVTSLGDEVRYVFISSTVIEGHADGRVIFRLTLSDGADPNTNEDYLFELNDQIDHPDPSPPVDDGSGPLGQFEETMFLDLSDVVQVTDSAAQTAVLGALSADPVFTVGVIDDTPTGDTESVPVKLVGEFLLPDDPIDDEDQTPAFPPGSDGIQDGLGDDGDGTSTAGSIDILYGADLYDPAAHTIPHNPLTISATVLAISETEPPGAVPLQVVYVDAAGNGVPEPITTQWVDDPAGGGTLYGYSAHFTELDANPVFTLVIDVDGNYTFTAFAPLAHPLTDDPESEPDVETEYEDNLTLQFTYLATDYDGDQFTGKINIEVDDDTGDIDVSATGIIYDTDNFDAESPVPLLNLDESIDSLNDTFNPDPVNGEDIYNADAGETGESVTGDPNGDLDDVAGNTAPDPTGTNPIGRLETGVGHLDGVIEPVYVPGDIEELFDFSVQAGADGLKSLTHDLSLTLFDGNGEPVEGENVATTLQVTQPADGGNPDANADAGDGEFTTYDDPTIYLVQVTPLIVEGRVSHNDGDPREPNYDVALRITLVDPTPADLGDAKLVVEQFMAIDHDGDDDFFDTQLPLFIDGGGFSGYTLGLTLESTITDGDNDAETSEPVTVTLISDDQDGTTFVAIDDDGPQVSVSAEASQEELAALALNLDESIDSAGDGFDPDPANGEDLYSAGDAALPLPDYPDNNGDLDDVDGNTAPVLTTDNASTANFGRLATGLEGGLAVLFGDAVIDFGTDGALSDEGETSEDAATELLSLVLTGVDEGTGVKTNLVATELDDLLEGTSVDDRTIWLFLENDGSGNNIIVGRIGQADGVENDPGNDYVAFTISLSDPDPDLAQLVVKQYLAIDHDASELAGQDPDQQAPEDPSLYDEEIALLLAADEIGKSVGLQFEVTVSDNDTDSVTDSAVIDLITTATSFLSFDDDGPDDAQATNGSGTLVHDETPGVDTDDVEDDVAGPLTVFDPITDKGNDPDVTPLILTDAIGFAQGTLDFSILFDAGTDLPKPDDGDPQYALRVFEDGVFSGLATTEGLDIYLFLEDAGTEIVVGRVESSSGDAAFAIHIDPATGQLSLVQYLSILHDDRGDPDEADDDGTDTNDADPDEGVGFEPIQQTLASGTLFIDVTLSDGDDDSIVASADISERVIFQDDGPELTIRVSEQTSASLILDFDLDETVQPDGGDDDTYDRANPPEVHDGNGGFDDVLNTSTLAAGDYNRIPVIDPDPDASQAIGHKETDAGELANLFFFGDPDYGADGPLGGSDETARDDKLELVLSTGELPAETNLVATALPDTDLELLSVDDRTIHLIQVDEFTIEGRIPGLDGVLGTGDDDFVAFRITLTSDDPDTAQLMIDHFLPIDHDASDDTVPEAVEDPSVFDEEVILKLVNADLLGLQLTSTVTDGDEDPFTTSTVLDLAGSTTSFFTFDDDGPEIEASATANVEILLDETIVSDDGPVPGGDNADDDDVLGVGGPQPGHPTAFGSRTLLGADYISSLFSTIDAGTDGEKDRVHALVLKDGDQIIDAEGEYLESGIAVTQPFPGGNPGGTPYDNPLIYFFFEAGVIVGRVGMLDGLLDPVADPDGDIALTIEIDADTGDITVKQFLAIYHDGNDTSFDGDGNDHDTALSLVSGIEGVFVSLTLTDGDDDSLSETSLAGLTLTIEDDGIVANASLADPVVTTEFPGPFPTVLDDEGTNILGIESPDEAANDENDPPDGSGEALVQATGTLDIDIGTDGLVGVSLVNETVDESDPEFGLPVVMVEDQLGGDQTPLQAIYVDINGDLYGARQGLVRDVLYSWDAGTGILTGFAYVNGIDDTDGEFTVFTLDVDDDGTFVFDLEAPLAHFFENDPASGADDLTVFEYEDDLSLIFSYWAFDGDGDFDDSTLTIVVNDDTPDLGTPPDSLDGFIPSATIVNTPGDAEASETNDLNFFPGADGWKGASLAGNIPPDGLTSGGVQVEYFVDPLNPNVLIGFLEGGDPNDTDDQVFILTVDPGASTSGEYTFTLLQPLDGEIEEDVAIGSAFGAGPDSWRILTTAAPDLDHLSVVSGWNTNGSFNLAAWQGGNDAGVVVGSVNGSTNGWGVSNQNFTTGELLRFDFGAQVDFDEGAAYVPPAIFSGGEVNKATFDFNTFEAGDSIAYVIHYTDLTIESDTFDPGVDESLNGAELAGGIIGFQTLGKFIDYIEFFAISASGDGKVDLVSVSVIEETVDVNLAFDVTLTDGDDDAETGTINVNVAEDDSEPEAEPFGVFSINTTDVTGLNLEPTDDGELMSIGQPSPAPPYANVATFLNESTWGGGQDNNIDALHVLDDGRILFSTSGGTVKRDVGGELKPEDFPGGGRMDIFLYDPITGQVTIPSDLDFPGVRFPTTFAADAKGKLDALHVLEDGSIIFSVLGGPFTLDGVSFDGNDLIHWDGFDATKVFEGNADADAVGIKGLVGAQLFTGEFDPDDPTPFLDGGNPVFIDSDIGDNFNALHVENYEIISGDVVLTHFFISPGSNPIKLDGGDNAVGNDAFSQTELIEVFRADNGTYWVNAMPAFDSGRIAPPAPSSNDGHDIDAFSLVFAVAPLIFASEISYWSTDSGGDQTFINRVNFFDQDAGAALVRVTFTSENADDDFDGIAGGGVTIISGDETESITVQGTVASINEWLAAGNLRWDPDGNATPDRAITVVIDDNGATAGGNVAVDVFNITHAPQTFSDPNQDNANLAFLNINEADPSLGTGVVNDSIITSWAHGPSTSGGGNDVIYDGGVGTEDTVTLVFRPALLELILPGAAMAGYFDGNLADSETLDLGSTSWNGQVQGFEAASIALAAGHDRHVVYNAFGATLPAFATGNTGSAGVTNDFRGGTAGDNTMHGGISASDTAANGHDILLGLGGNDTLWGGAGNDLLLGGAGNDTVRGGNGIDVLSGGTGADTFVFTATDAEGDGNPDLNADFIVDYSFMEGDKLDLSALLNGPVDASLGHQIEDYVRLIATPGDANSLTVQVDVDGTGAVSDWADVAVLSGYSQTSADIVRVAFESADHNISV